MKNKCLIVVIFMSSLTGGIMGQEATKGMAYAKWRESLPKDYPQLADYRRVLLRWVEGAEPGWVSDPAYPDIGKCKWRSKSVLVCTARTLSVYTALAADTECEDAVWTRQKLAGRLNAAISFLCAKYSFCAPTLPWPKGKWCKTPSRDGAHRHRHETWIIGNMLDVVQIVPDLVTAENRQRIREILIDIVEDERTSGRARELSDYCHEGITWTINLLARAAVLYPDHPNAKEWLDLAKHGYASSLSVEADLKDDTVIDGKQIKKWVSRRCPVFHPTFTLHHHGLGIHPGYMSAAAVRMVSLYDLMKRSGKTISPIWYHHYRDVMEVIKGLALWDGRIAYPNGKDWPDYLYGVSGFRFHMAGLQMMFDDGEARLIEKGLFRQLEWLQLKRGRGDFGHSSAEYSFNVNDASAIASAYCLHQAHGFAGPVTQAQFDGAHARVFYSPYAKFVCVRDPARFASWGWHAAKRGTTGLIIPRGHELGDHLVHWDGNLTPNYWAMDKAAGRQRRLQGRASRQVETFPGGFSVSERTEFRGVFDHRVMVAIPDGRTVIFACSARATDAVIQLGTWDISWRLARSVFADGNKRTVFHEKGKQEVDSMSGVQTRWLNVDGIMGIVSVGRPARVSSYDSSHGVCLGVCSLGRSDYEAGQEIFTTCCAFITDVDAVQTKRLVKAYHEEKTGDTARVYRIRGQDGKQYVVAVNFASSGADVRITGSRAGRLLTPKAARIAGRSGRDIQLRLMSRGCALWAS